MKSAILWTIFWVLLSVAFGIGVYFTMGPELASQFFSAYLIEKSLSVDNLFVFSLIFAYFGIPTKQQSVYLTWGIIGAFVLRGLLIGTGVTLVEHFHWIMYLFGIFLVYSAIKLLQADEEDDVKDSWIVKWAESKNLSLFWMVIICIEVSDLLFALDSIPATFAISHNLFIVYSSNMLAIFGLRSLYFVLAHLLDRICYLKYGVSLVLALIGTKMLIEPFFTMPTWIWLCFVAGLLGSSVLLSVIKPVPCKEGEIHVSKVT